MFHVKQILNLADKSKAYHGFQLGSLKVRKHVRLINIARSGNELCFSVTGHTKLGVTHIHIPRVLIRDRWIDAIFRPYHAGEEAASIAVSWWNREGIAGEPEPESDHIIDPDIEKWMTDATV